MLQMQRPCRIGLSLLALVSLPSCREGGANPPSSEGAHLRAAKPPAVGVTPAGEPGAPGQVTSQDSRPAGVILRLKGPSTFETHEKARGGGAAAARLAAQGQRRGNRAQHARVLSTLAAKIGPLPARRGQHRVLGPSHESFTDALNALALHGIDEDAARNALQGEPDVISIEPIVEIQTTLLESVPLIHADDLWAIPDGNGIGVDGTGMRIGIVDTGVDYTHPDLGGCFGPGCKVAGGYDFYNDDSDPLDDNGHGTHVAATAAGAGTYAGPSGSTPIPGVAPAAQIFAYKVLGASGSGPNTAIIAAIERCADPDDDGDPTDHLDVCNLSLGGSGNPDDAGSTAVDNATASGVVFAVSAGNAGPNPSTIGSPGTARQAITVAAACKPSSIGVDYRCDQAISSSSSRGPVVWITASGTQTLAKPDIAAPGVSICAAAWSSYQGGRCLDSTHASLSGTSMAAPHVAGAAALLRQAHPEWAPQQVKSFLASGATDLGLDAYTQGAGLIDALQTLNLGGLPSSFARIGGTPLLDVDVPTTRFATFSSDIAVTNTSAQELTFSASFAGDAGLTVDLAPTILTLAAGASGTIAVTRYVDHDVVPSGVQAAGTITLATALGEAHVGLLVGVRDRLVAQPAPLDLGVDLASQAQWTGQANLQLQNLRVDAGGSYTASITCCKSGSQDGGGNITASLDQSTITLEPGGTATLGVTVLATNAPLVNARWNGTVTLASTLGTVNVPLTFFKGYGIRLNVSPTLPETVQLSSAQSGSTGVYPVTSSTMTFLSATPGPFFAEARWLSGGSGYQAFHVVAGPLDTDVPLREVTLDKAQAVHTIELRPVDQNGATPTRTSITYRFTHSASGGGARTFTWFYGNGKIRTSPIPAEVRFTGTATSHSPDLLAYFYELPGPLAEDHILTNSAAELVPKELRAIRPVSAGNVPYIEPWVGIPLPYWTNYGVMWGGGVTITEHTLDPVPLPSGTGMMYVYNNSTRDLRSEPYPDASSLKLYLRDGSPTGQTLYTSPLLHLSSTHNYAWSSTVPHAYGIRLDQVYARFMCDEPPGNLLPFGPGPLVNEWSWDSSGTGHFVYWPWAGVPGPAYAWGACWLDAVTRPTSYRLYRNEALVASGSLAPSSALYPGATVGSYRMEVTSQANVAGTDVAVETVTTFSLLASATRDENPPRMRFLHLLGRGLWQDVLDVGTLNRLRFGLDPVPGLGASNPSPPPLYTPMADALASVTLQQSSDGVAWVDVPITAVGNDEYLSDELSLLDSAATVWFRASASDTVGNTFRHTFQIPRGSGYAAAGADTTPPTTVIASPAPGAEVEGVVTVVAVATDDVAVARVDLLVDGIKVGSTAMAPYTFTWNSGSVAAGAHQLQARAIDTGENLALSAPVTVVVIARDTVSPVVSFTAPAAGALLRGTVALEATASDDRGVARVELYDGVVLIDSDASAPYTASWPTSADGAHTLRAVAVDAAGNSATASLNVTVDNTAPTVALTAPADGSNVNGVVAITADANDASGIAQVDFYDGAAPIGSASVAPFTLHWNTAGLSGPHTLTARALDGAGNWATSAPRTVTVVSDAIPPTVALTAPNNGATVSGNVNVNATASDNVGVTRVEFYRDGTVLLGTDTTRSYSISWNTTTTPAGSHTLTAVAYDAVGNATTSSARTVTVKDSTAPTVAITAPVNGSFVPVGSVVTIQANASDVSGIAKVDFYVAGKVTCTDTTEPYSCNWTVPAGTGKRYSLQAKAYDVPGNNKNSATITVTSQ